MDLSPLRYCTELETLELRSTSATDLSPLMALVTLQDSEERLRTIFAQAPIGIDTVDSNYSANEATIDARVLDGPTGPNGDVGRQLCGAF